MTVMTEVKPGVVKVRKKPEPAKTFKPDGTIDLTAEGISKEDYLTCLHAIADAMNALRDKHSWCWVWVKFAAALNPLIVQGKRIKREGAGTYAVKVLEPRPEDRYPREWFTPAGWDVYEQVNKDSDRMNELRLTYKRILQVVKDKERTRNGITMDEAQEVFRKAKLPLYGEHSTWTGRVEVYTRSELISEDLAADKEKIAAAWKEFLAVTGLKEYDLGNYPSYDGHGAAIEIRDADTAALIGEPQRSYDPSILPDGTRLTDPNK